MARVLSGGGGTQGILQLNGRILSGLDEATAARLWNRRRTRYLASPGLSGESRFPTGSDAEGKISRTPADQSGEEGDGADPAPDRQDAVCGQANQGHSDDDPKSTINTANITQHG